MQDRIEALKKRGKAFRNASELTDNIKNNADFADEIRFLAKELLNKTVTGCGNCLADAYFEIINIKNMPSEKYSLRAGVVLPDPTGNFDKSKMLTRKTLTDELAELHLRENKNAWKYFDRLPGDWRKCLNVNAGTESETDANVNTDAEKTEVVAEKKAAPDAKKKTALDNSYNLGADDSIV